MLTRVIKKKSFIFQRHGDSVSSVLLHMLKKTLKQTAMIENNVGEKPKSTKHCPNSLSRTALHLLLNLMFFQISSHSIGGNSPVCDVVLPGSGHLCSRPRD